MHDIIVVSDLHLGRGKNPATGRYHQLEAFFYDEDFGQFCHWLCDQADERKTPFKLVLNGDVFDLLRVENEVSDADTTHEKHYGPYMVPRVAADTISQILEGHPIFVQALGHVLRCGHRIVIMPGNHDIETQWEPVREVIRSRIMGAVEASDGAGAASACSERLVFESWFHYEPGRVWIEHGCQYDPENSFHYYLREKLSDRPEVIKTELDMPMGTFFQKYLYNRFGNITFMVPDSKANLRYVRWLLINKPRLLARVATRHFPFFYQVVRRVAKTQGEIRYHKEAHSQSLDELTERHKLDKELHEIDALKKTRGTAAAVARSIVAQVLKVVGITLLVAFIVAGLWFGGFHAIMEMPSGFGLKATLFVVLNIFFFGGAAVIGLYFLLRPPKGAPPWPMRRAAREIARKLDVPIVTFGHSHEEIVWRIDRSAEAPAWYFNTGTWIAIFNYDELVPRDRVQYTFLRIRGNDGELLHWSPGRGEAVPVILLDQQDRFGEPARATEAQAS